MSEKKKFRVVSESELKPRLTSDFHKKTIVIGESKFHGHQGAL